MVEHLHLFHGKQLQTLLWSLRILRPPEKFFKSKNQREDFWKFLLAVICSRLQSLALTPTQMSQILFDLGSLEIPVNSLNPDFLEIWFAASRRKMHEFDFESILNSLQELKIFKSSSNLCFIKSQVYFHGEVLIPTLDSNLDPKSQTPRQSFNRGPVLNSDLNSDPDLKSKSETQIPNSETRFQTQTPNPSLKLKSQNQIQNLDLEGLLMILGRFRRF